MKFGKKTLLSALLSAGVIAAATGGIAAFAEEQPAAAEERIKAETLFETGRGITAQSNVNAPANGVSGYYKSGESGGKYIISQKKDEDVPTWQKNGLLVTSTTERERLTFKNEVDIGSATKEDILIALQPLSSKQGASYDFRGIKIYLTDAEDKSNYVCIDVYPELAQYVGYTLMKVSTSDFSKGLAYRYGGYRDMSFNDTWHDAYEGTPRRDFYGDYLMGGVNTLDQYVKEWKYKFEGAETAAENGIVSTDMYLAPLAFSYDAEDKSVWYGKSCLLDLDHTESVGVGKEFKGFSSGKIVISVQTYDITGNSARYMVYNVAGQSLCGEYVLDEISPYFVENLPAGDELPRALAGVPYKGFDVTAYDMLDGEITPELYYKGEDDAEFMPIDGDSFVPVAPGKYILRYEAKDRSGNEAYKEYRITAQYSVPEIVIGAELAKSEYKAGERVALPEYTIAGGSGEVHTRARVIRVADGTEFEFTNGYFQPVTAGKYDLVIEASDYIGQTVKKTLAFTVTLSASPVVETEKPMYEKLADGNKIVFPALNTYDYSVYGQKMNVRTEITVRGTGEKSGVYEKLAGFVFVPNKNKFGENIEVEYKLYGRKTGSEPLTRVFPMKIVSPLRAYDYLAWNESELNIDAAASSDGKGYITELKALSAGELEARFINPVLFDGFDVQLNCGSAAFKGRAEIVFTDAENEENTSRIKLYNQDENSTRAEYRGETADIQGSFVSGKIFLEILNGCVYDNYGNKLFELKEIFVSNQARVAIVLHANAAGDSLKLKQLGTTFFDGRYDRKGEIPVFKSYVAPKIVLQGKLPVEKGYGEILAIPEAKGYSDLSPYVETCVSLVAPDGEVLIDGASADKSYSAALKQYGKYEVQFQATDSAGNTKNESYDVYVYDKNAPVIDYSGSTVYEIGVGQSVNIAKLNVYDSADEAPVYRVFLINEKGKLIEIDFGEYTVSEKGKYVLRHVCYDSSYNYAILDICISVK